MSISRREFVLASAFAAPIVRTLQLPVDRPIRASARLAVITDLHHGLAPDALTRFDAFLGAVAVRKDLEAVWQLGDFCYSDAGSADCLARWRSVALPRHNVLGNHDMDKVDKAAAMSAWGMPARYYAAVIGGWRFVVLDLNHYKKDGALHAYANGNYFAAGVSHNWADPEQLTWLDREIRASAEPVVLVSHQPIGLGSSAGSVPPEQQQVLDVVTNAGRANPRGRVRCCISGHLHVDRLELADGLPCVCVNSASYFWSGGMHAYTAPLFAFMEFGTDGTLRIEGRRGAFVAPPPAASDAVVGRSPSITDRRIQIGIGG